MRINLTKYITFRHVFCRNRYISFLIDFRKASVQFKQYEANMQFPLFPIGRPLLSFPDIHLDPVIHLISSKAPYSETLFFYLDG